MAGFLSCRSKAFGLCLSSSSGTISKTTLLLCQRQFQCLGGVSLQLEDLASPLSSSSSPSSSKRVGTIVTNKLPIVYTPASRQFFSLPKLPTAVKRKEYSERRILGYTMEQMYEIVADVDSYPEFVPWCTKSDIFETRNNGFKARLEIGFPPIKERYVSTVKLVRPNLVHAECSEGKLFSQLINLWKFSPGIPGNPKTCTLDFAVVFEFRSQLHSKLATVFFDEIVRTMVKSFLKRAYTIHGPESIQSQKPKVLVYVA